MTPVTWGLTHSGLGSLSRTDFLPVRHTETLCVSCSARRHRPVPWPHVRPGWAASCAVSPSHGLTPFRPPPPHTRLPRAAAALRRRRPVPHPSWCRSKFPGQRASPELADSSNRKSRCCFPTAHGQAWSRGRRTRRSRGRGLRDGRGPVRGRRRDRTRGRGAQSPGCGIRRASELPQRRGEAGGATRVRILLAPPWVSDPGLGLRASSLPARPRQLQQPRSRAHAAPGPGSASARATP